MILDWSRSRLPPFRHQKEDAAQVINLPYLFITSEMRTGKSKIVIDGAQFLFEQGTIDRVIVVAPDPVRDVWYDPVLGELSKHLWDNLDAEIIEYQDRTRLWFRGPLARSGIIADPKHRYMEWLCTNYEFLRSKNRVIQLLPYCGPKTLLVLDESSYVKNWKSQQTKACVQLRNQCGRVILLNGTPISHSHMDLFSQGNLLHKSVLDCNGITRFKIRYTEQVPIMRAGGQPLTSPRGFIIKKVGGWKNLDDLRRRFAPYTIRRLQKDLDLPPKLDAVTLTATLTEKTWQVYKDMRDEMVVWLQNGNVATSTSAAIKALRLSQITSGFLGGVERARIDAAEHFDELNDSLPEDLVSEHIYTQEVGREKLDVLLWFLGQRLEAEPAPHLVSWFRFRPELFRALREVPLVYPQFEVGSIVGAQDKAERHHAMALLKPETTPRDRPVFVGGTYGTGSFGLDFTGANTSINCSFDYSLGKFKQSGDRIYGPGMIGPAAYFDIIAVGPRGQRTIDHAIVAARRNNEDLANWTTDTWVQKLTEE